MSKARGVEVAAEGLAVVELNDDLFVGRSRGSEFQRVGFPLQNDADLHRMSLYVMLSAKFLSTYCF
jgi:hypothetical protein